jgi:hypothetical protein
LLSSDERFSEWRSSDDPTKEPFSLFPQSKLPPPDRKLFFFPIRQMGSVMQDLASYWLQKCPVSETSFWQQLLEGKNGLIVTPPPCFDPLPPAPHLAFQTTPIGNNDSVWISLSFDSKENRFLKENQHGKLEYCGLDFAKKWLPDALQDLASRNDTVKALLEGREPEKKKRKLQRKK